VLIGNVVQINFGVIWHFVLSFFSYPLDDREMGMLEMHRLYCPFMLTINFFIYSYRKNVNLF